MSFKDNFPTGVKIIVIERDIGKAIKFDPNNLEETVRAVQEMCGSNIKGVTVTKNPDPRIAAWKKSVASDETKLSFEGFCDAIEP